MSDGNNDETEGKTRRYATWDEIKRGKLSEEKIAELKDEARREIERDGLLDDVDRWESRELGADPEHARRSAPGRREELDEKLGIVELTLRLKRETVDELERQAKDEEIILAALLRRILQEHVDERQDPIT